MSGKILAKVGTLTVTEEEVVEFIDRLGPRGASYKSPEGMKAVLNQLIGNKLLLQDARRNLYEGEAAFREELNRLKETLLINYAGEKAISGAKVTEDEILAYYNENKERFLAEESVNASHILVDTEEKALEILEKINTGAATFENAAKDFSSCPSGQGGGALGDFSRGQMVKEFDEAVFSMEIGEISKAPVKTQFGYHIIRLNSKTEQKPVELKEVREELYNMLLNEKRKALYESKINQLKIMYPVDIMI